MTRYYFVFIQWEVVWLPPNVYLIGFVLVVGVFLAVDRHLDCCYLDNLYIDLTWTPKNSTASAVVVVK